MKPEILILVCSGVAFGCAMGIYFFKKYNISHHSNDISYANQAVYYLHRARDAIPHITDEKLLEHFENGDVMLAKHPSGAWPSALELTSRLYNWQPGYATSGWSYRMRPGMSYTRWPRNRWIRNNGSFYFINNGKDRRFL